MTDDASPNNTLHTPQISPRVKEHDQESLRRANHRRMRPVAHERASDPNPQTSQPGFLRGK